MKQLIQPIYKECVYYKNLKTNKITIFEKEKQYCKLIYSEPKETNRETINNFEEMRYCTYNGFKNKGKKYFEYYYLYKYDANKTKLKTGYLELHKTIWEENFVMMTKTKEYEIEDEEYYTLERLMKNLSANDMIEFMKDRGMTYCPMIK